MTDANNIVVFRERGAEPIRFLLRKPVVRAVLCNAQIESWGWWVTFRGTQEQLIAASVATPEMFENLGKSGVRTAPTGYGDQYTIKRRKAYYELQISTGAGEIYGDIAEPKVRKYQIWRNHGTQIEAIVAGAIAKARSTKGAAS